MGREGRLPPPAYTCLDQPVGWFVAAVAACLGRRVCSTMQRGECYGHGLWGVSAGCGDPPRLRGWKVFCQGRDERATLQPAGAAPRRARWAWPMWTELCCVRTVEVTEALFVGPVGKRAAGGCLEPWCADVPGGTCLEGLAWESMHQCINHS